MRRFLFGAFLFLTPAFAFAAGFAKQSIFLSTTAPVEGQKILIHASVSNPTTSTFTGTLVVKTEASEIGSVPVKLDAGAADDISVSWTPTAGTHTIVADLKDTAGAIVEEDTQAFTIAPSPTASSPISATPAQFINTQTPVDVQSSAPIQQSITNVSPAVAQYTSPVLNTIDSGRTAAAAQLHTAIDWSKSQIATPSSKSGPTQTAWKVLATASLYALTILLYIVGNVGVFYPILAFLFLYILWRLYRRYRRR